MNQCIRLLFLLIIVVVQINLTSLLPMKALPGRIFFSSLLVAYLLQHRRIEKLARDMTFIQREMCLWLFFLVILLTAPVLLPTQAFLASFMYLLINPNVWVWLDQRLQVNKRIKEWGKPPLVLCDDSESPLKIIVQIGDGSMLNVVTKRLYEVLGTLSDQDLQGSTLVVNGDKNFEPHFSNILKLRLIRDYK